MNTILAKKINDLLLADAGVIAVCADRSYTGEAPQGVQSPYNVLNHIDSSPEETLDDSATMEDTMIQIDCYGKTPALAMDLRSAISNLLIKKEGDTPAIEGVVVYRPDGRCFKETNTELWCAQLDLTLMYNPTAS